MPSSSNLPAIQGVNIDINVIEGRNLVAKDSSGVFSKKKSSDPYVKVYFGGKKYGKTQTIDKTLSPSWNESFNIKLGTKEVGKILKGNSKYTSIDFVIFDEDNIGSDDPMGTVSIPFVVRDTPPDISAQWYKVEKGNGEYFCKKASGELLLKVSISVIQMMSMVRGNSQEIPCSTVLHVGKS